jgi:hypothetical protein
MGHNGRDFNITAKAEAAAPHDDDDDRPDPCHRRPWRGRRERAGTALPLCLNFHGPFLVWACLGVGLAFCLVGLLI